MSVPKAVTKADLALLKERFYTKEGKLFAKTRYANRIKIGQEVGCNNGSGYLVVMCNYRLHMVHRIVYYLTSGDWPLLVVDHINGNTLDNRPCNLREVTQGENTRAFSSARKDSTSKFRGVSLTDRGKWSSEIMSNGERYRKSGFLSELEAALWYSIQAKGLGFAKESFNSVF